ncbi:MAG: amidohydrolase family protein [Proteobacteria bacterium]|nr:amidohydrolase family protein [Pseudomonadota bacterium]
MPKTSRGRCRVGSCALASLLFVTAGVCLGAGPKGPAAERDDAVADPYPSTYVPRKSGPVVLVGATILDGIGGRIDSGEIVLRDGKVAAIGTSVERPAGAVIVDARGRWITPGLIDVHTHIGTYTLPQTSLSATVGDVTEMHKPDASATWIEHGVRSADPGFARALAAGVTTMQILPGSGVLLGGRSVVVKPIAAPTVAAMKFPDAPQGLKMACGDNPKEEEGHGGFNSRQGLMAELREKLTGIQEYRRSPPPHRDFEKNTLAAVLDGKIAVHVHCYRSDDMARIIDLSREFGFRIAAFHHASEAYKIAPLLVRAGICVAGWPDWWGFKPEAEDAIRENVAFVDAAGGCAMMHSDIPMLSEHLNTEAAKAAAAGRRSGLSEPPEHVIRWITSNPAKALGLDDRIGKLSPGANADVVLWSGDPFSVYSRVDGVYIDGALVFDRAHPPPPSDFEIGRTITEGRQ